MALKFSVLLTGATGYIGGSVLSEIAHSDEYTVTVLVRQQAHADKIKSVLGINTVVGTLDDLELIEKLASESDVVLDTALAAHTEAPKAFIAGLKKRKATTGKETHYIHTSGTSILGDLASGEYASERIYHDTEDLYEVEKQLQEELGPYSYRTADMTTVDAGLEHGVKTYVVVPPTIYGKGTGLFKVSSHQVPTLVKVAVAQKRAYHAGKGLSIWTHIHIKDCSSLYVALLRSAVAGAAFSGREGYYFMENGERSWKRLSDEIAKALAAKLGPGLVQSTESAPFASDEEAAKWLGDGNKVVVIKGFSSNSRVRATRSRTLGWKPVHPDEDLYKDLPREIEEALQLAH